MTRHQHARTGPAGVAPDPAAEMQGRAHVRLPIPAMTWTLALALVVLAADQAAAQSAPWQAEPPAAGWSVTPGLGAGLSHDSNVQLRTSAPGSGDWVVLLHPRGEIDFVGRRTRFNAGYAGEIEAVRAADYLNRYQQRAQIGSSRMLSRRLTVSGDASLLRSPTSDGVEDGTIPFAAVGSTAFTTNAAFDATLTRRARLGAGCRFYRLEYDERDLDSEFAFLRGGHAQTPTVRLGYDVSRRLSLHGDWSYTQGRVTSEVGDFRLQEVGGGWSYRLREQTAIGAGGGATAISAPAVGVRGWQPAVQAVVRQQAGPNVISLQYRYAVVPAFSHGGLARQQRIEAGVQVPLMVGRAYVSGSVALSRDEALEGIGSGLDMRSLWLQGTVGYHLARWLRAETFVNTARQRGLFDFDDQGIQRTRIGVQFVTARPMRID
jgi:hypothetical protein